MPDNSEIASLVSDLQSWNAHTIRQTAIQKLSKINQYNRLAINALQSIVKDSSYFELGKAAQEAIDAIYLSGQIKKPAHQRTLLTNVVVTIETDNSMEIEAAKTFCRCNFCEKESVINSLTHRFIDGLSGPERFYCCFCLRHKLNQRDARHTLIMSFRGIIGYYFYGFYSLSKSVLMTVSEIMDYINLHVQAGSQNPLFIYDPETFLWFIDFTRIGQSRRKLPIEQVLATVSEILLAFNMHENVRDMSPYKMYLKYEEAILSFYHQRSRPIGSRILSPTLFKTGAADYAAEKLAKDITDHTTTHGMNGEKRKINFEDTRNFLPSVLQEAIGKKY